MSLPEILTRPTTEPVQALDPTATAAKLDAVGEESDVGDLIASATDLVERLTNLRLWFREYREEACGDGTERLYLGARPIVSVSSVSSSAFGDVEEGDDDGEFQIRSEHGFLTLRDGGTWPAVTWTVDYFAGWWLLSMDPDPLPAGVQRLEEDRPSISGAVFEIVKLSWERQNASDVVKRVESQMTETEYFPSHDLWAPRRAVLTLGSIRRPVV